VFKISLQAEVVTYPRRNVTMVCGASYHIFGSCIYLQDTKIRFRLQFESYISNWLFSKSRLLASYVCRHKTMAYDRPKRPEYRTTTLSHPQHQGGGDGLTNSRGGRMPSLCLIVALLISRHSSSCCVAYLTPLVISSSSCCCHCHLVVIWLSSSSSSS
jgi:hypothetical protein